VTPASQVAIVLDKDVLSAPMVVQSLTGGEAQTTGTYTRESATELAALIGSGALPVALSASDVTRTRS
jgi:preprotein translocase subunit SecD